MRIDAPIVSRGGSVRKFKKNVCIYLVYLSLSISICVYMYIYIYITMYIVLLIHITHLMFLDTITPSACTRVQQAEAKLLSKDLHLWEPRVRRGGIIAGHDFTARHWKKLPFSVWILRS